MRQLHARDVDLYPHLHARRWHALPLLCLACALPLCVVGCGRASDVLGAGAAPSPTLTQKQVALATYAAYETAVAGQPHAPKYPGTLGTPVASCPLPTPQPGIVAPSLPTQGYPDAVVDNSTAAIPADHPQFDYVILAGNRKSNPQQGLLIVQRFVTDSCADPTPNGGTVWTYYNTPLQQGHVQLTRVAGDTVIFTTAHGGGGAQRFDFVTGQFL
jgi:hypothetical protein